MKCLDLHQKKKNKDMLLKMLMWKMSGPQKMKPRVCYLFFEISVANGHFLSGIIIIKHEK